MIPENWWMTGRRLVFGPPAPDQVPERVSAAIQREQERSEVLVSLIQCFAILGFFVLYHLSPKAFPDDVAFEPVPIALGFYAVFTVVRLLLAIRRRLTPFILAISVVIDVVILMVTIWSFHLQYQAPPALYLKAPTLMYVFILIALRALRFEARLVLLGGITAALCWLFLLAYAWYADPAMMRTSDYAVYVTSHSILVGAELDKVVSILAVTFVLAIALHRGQKLLIRSAQDAQAAAELSRFFAPEVAGMITQSEHSAEPGQAELRGAAIMFVDLRDFTTLSSRLTPNEVMLVLGEYQSRMVAVIRQHGGSIDKFMGDGILASFGATAPRECPLADAMRAIEAVVGEAGTWAEVRRRDGLEKIDVAVAIAEGNVMFGVVGGSERLEYTVIGEAVNLAAKLEKHCKVEKVSALAPRSLFEQANAQSFIPDLIWQTRRDREVAGVTKPLDLVVLGQESN